MISVLGEALVDLVITPDGAVEAKLGGAPFNTARACGRLGSAVRFVGALSVDRFGTMLAAQLSDDGVELGSERVDLPTTLAAAELDESGAAQYRFYLDGTSAPALRSIDADVSEADVVFTGGLGLVLDPMADTIEATLCARGPDQIVMVDINCRPRVIADRDRYITRLERILERADVVKASDEDLAFLSPGVDPIEAASSILQSGPSAMLITRGGDGVDVLTGAGNAHVEVGSVEVVDTIGAGDAFCGGFLSWWVATGSRRGDAADVGRVVAAVRAANEVAAVVVTRRGADPPRREELPASWST